jgi:multidrug transporter EmrE-like cation transporter
MISNLFFFFQILFASIIEFIGDASFKIYSRMNSHLALLTGIISYILLIYMLIEILKYSNVMQMNIQWDALSVILETLFAYILFRETLSGYPQYIGFFMIITGLIIMNMGTHSYN